MQLDEMKRILEKYKGLFDALKEYDETRELPFQRKRVNISLSVRTIKKLKELKKKTGRSVSEIIEGRIEKY